MRLSAWLISIVSLAFKFEQYPVVAELQVWIDGKKVANIGPGHRYDKSIPAGHHVLAVNYTPRTRYQPISMQLTVRPGEIYAFTAVRESDQGVSFRQSNRIPP